MKRIVPIFLITLLAGSSFMLQGCKDTLQPKVYQNLTPQTFFKSQADFNNALAALYNPFSTDYGVTDQGAGQYYAYLYNADPKTYLGRSEITTDELYTPFYAQFTNFTWGSSSNLLDSENGATYAKIRYVARATDAINKMQNSSADVSDDVKNRDIAQAKCLRGWLMFILYDFFGPVNVKLKAATLSDTDITPRLSKDDYVAAIEKDENDAIPNLVDKYNNDADNWGRVTKGVARMVLLRLYLHDKRWADAQAVGEKLMNMGFSLMDNYEDVFNEPRNNELIYAVPANSSSPNYWVTEVFSGDFRSAKNGTITDGDGGYGVYYMPWDFYDKFSSQDQRLNTIISSYTNSSGNTVNRSNGMPGAIPLKYTGFQGNGPGYSLDQPVFRYAEVLLSVAEAINQQNGPNTQAYNLVDKVRNRAGLPDWPQTMSKQQFSDSLLAERGREFYGEGLRREDLIRHGKFIDYAQNRTYSSGAKDFMTLFPIPEDVIQQGDGVIEQNPGYQ